MSYILLCLPSIIHHPPIINHSLPEGAASGSGIVSMLEVIESDFGRSLAQAESIESSRAEEHDSMTKQNKLTEVLVKWWSGLVKGWYMMIYDDIWWYMNVGEHGRNDQIPWNLAWWVAVANHSWLPSGNLTVCYWTWPIYSGFTH